MDGVLVVYKEKGITSFDAVARLRRITGQKKIGHMGTLDPAAEGVLPVCLGCATKLADRLSDGEKVYRAVLLLGIETDTQDAEGNVLARNPVDMDEETVRNAVKAFIGTQSQLTPMYSARKIEGKKLVDLARKGKEIDRPSREITVHSIEITGIELPRVILRIRCSRGTYIRTICHDIGQKLGCGGIMEELLREEAGGFTLDECLSLSHIDALMLTGGLEEHFYDTSRLLKDLPHFRVYPSSDRFLENGNRLTFDNGCFVGDAPAEYGYIAVENSEGRIMGLYNGDAAAAPLKPETMLLPDRDQPVKSRKAAPSVVSIGKFDGFHLGHQKILSVMKEKAADEGLRTVLFGFSSSPQAILSGKRSASILSEKEKHSLVRGFGVDQLAEFPFTEEIRRMSAEDFLEKILIGRLGMKECVIGPDCAFGYERRGNAEFLKNMSAKLGFGVTVVDKLRIGGEIVSSTRIRGLLTEGRMEEAAACLGYTYFIRGKVIHGAGLGRQLGFPTVNQEIRRDKLIPPFGVYISRVETNGVWYPSVSDLGVKPTVTGKGITGLETHILDYEGDLYGKELRTELISFLRPEMNFGGVDQLRAQLGRDLAAARAYFSAEKE